MLSVKQCQVRPTMSGPSFSQYSELTFAEKGTSGNL